MRETFYLTFYFEINNNSNYSKNIRIRLIKYFYMHIFIQFMRNGVSKEVKKYISRELND